jgi:transposase
MKTEIKRIDHLGIVAGVIKDLGLVELIDSRIAEHAKEEISTGEAIAGMIINGLGFSNRPLTLTPQFFQSKAMDRLFRKGIDASHFNRFKLGRALDDCYQYGCSNLFAEISMAVCKKEKVDCRFNSEDTTSFSLTGDYEPDCDEYAIKITHGFSKDHRPDLKQAIVEMMVSQDGGIPTVYNAHSGNASDNVIFRDRAQALIASFKNSDSPRYLIADSKLYTQETINSALHQIPFITRVPSSVKLEQESIADMLAVPLDRWNRQDGSNHYRSVLVRHYNLDQRWIVVYSNEMRERSRKRVAKALTAEETQLSNALFKNSKHRFSSVLDAEASITELNSQAKLYRVKIQDVKELKVYEGKGRPTELTPYRFAYQVEGTLEVNQQTVEAMVDQGSCYVLATTIPREELSDPEVIKAYKRQNDSVEKGFRFLKDPVFFTSSLFIKKPQRIEGLLMVMTLALLVYAIAQRIIRNKLKETGDTLPNQIKQEMTSPTLRWIFQMMEGIDLLMMEMEGDIQETVTGLTPLHLKILAYLPPPVQKIYGIAA